MDTALRLYEKAAFAPDRYIVDEIKVNYRPKQSE